MGDLEGRSPGPRCGGPVGVQGATAFGVSVDYPKPVRSMVRQALKKRSSVGW